MEGMTPQDPAQREPATLCQAVALYGLAGILGTCRHINAVGPHQGRNSPLIEGHDHKCGFGSRRLRAGLAHVRCRPWRASSAGRQPQARVSCHGFPPWRRESRHSRHAACHRHVLPLGGRASTVAVAGIAKTLWRDEGDPSGVAFDASSYTYAQEGVVNPLPTGEDQLKILL